MSDGDIRSPEAIELDEKINAFLLGLVDSLFDVKKLQRVEVLMRNAFAEGATISHAAQVQAAPELGKKKQDSLEKIEDLLSSGVAWAAAKLVGHLLGIEYSSKELHRAGGKPSDSKLGSAIADVIFAGLAGDGKALQPSDEGAHRVLGMLSHLTVSSWFEGILAEELTSLHGIVHPIEEISKLGHELITSLGLSRLARVALRPLVQDLVATPLQWKTNKTFTPKLLSEATAIRQFLRGKWDWADVEEELARQGYNSVRIDALYNEARKFQSIDDLAHLVWLGKMDVGAAAQIMRDQGFDEDTATNHFNVRKLEREESVFNGVVSAAVTAFVDRKIDELQLDGVLSIGVNSPLEHQLVVQAAQLRRSLNVKRLSSSEARAAAKAGILAVADYRTALEGEGYDEDAITVLDLLLRYELDASRSVAQHKADAEQAKRDADAARKAAADAKKAEIEAARQLRQQGTIAELEHAAVIGLIPIDRLRQTLAAQFTPDTVDIYIADVEQQRQAYLDAQRQKADAAMRAANKGLDVGQLEQAVYDDVISLDAFRAMLKAKAIVGADADILTATVKAKKADVDAAKQRRAAADLRAAQRHIDLSRAEQLVRLGIWTDAQYATLVRSLGFDDAAVAAMVQLLDATIAAAKAGTALRGAILARDPKSGLTIDQFRTAVKLGDKTLDQFQTFLVAAHYTADQQAVLVDELRSDLAVAEAARLRRTQGDTGAAPVPLLLATAAKAAQLGIITPAAYQQRLEAGGYSPEDVAIEMELLTAAMSKSAGSKKTQSDAPAPATSSGATLDAIAAQVKVGAATIEDFRSAAVGAGLDAATVDTLVQQLRDALATIADAQIRRDAIAAQLGVGGVSLDELEAAVLGGSLTVLAFEDRLASLGVTVADAQLVGSLLENAIAAKSGG